MLKHEFEIEDEKIASRQPPLRGCVLKHDAEPVFFIGDLQPPLRGCVLKLYVALSVNRLSEAAASARLCVETFICADSAAACNAAASARLCVETLLLLSAVAPLKRSRLCAAVC